MNVSIFLHHCDQKQWENKGLRPRIFKIKQEIHQSAGKKRTLIDKVKQLLVV